MVIDARSCTCKNRPIFFVPVLVCTWMSVHVGTLLVKVCWHILTRNQVCSTLFQFPGQGKPDLNNGDQ
jgi:hypothetical protein